MGIDLFEYLIQQDLTTLISEMKHLPHLCLMHSNYAIIPHNSQSDQVHDGSIVLIINCWRKVAHKFLPLALVS